MGAELDATRDDEQMCVAVELGANEPPGQLRGLCAVDRQLDLWEPEAIARARNRARRGADLLVSGDSDLRHVGGDDVTVVTPRGLLDRL